MKYICVVDIKKSGSLIPWENSLCIVDPGNHSLWGEHRIERYLWSPSDIRCRNISRTFLEPDHLVKLTRVQL